MHDFRRQKSIVSRGSKRLIRNPHRGRLGGVCAGLADYTGLSQTLFRVLFLISLLFGGLGFWVYFILWIALPAQDTTPLSGASFYLRWKLYEIGRLIARLHKIQTPRIADQGQQAYEAIRSLAPEIDPRQPNRLNPELARSALVDFPLMLKQVIRAGAAKNARLQDERIATLNRTFEYACNQWSEIARDHLLQDESGKSWDHGSDNSLYRAFKVRFRILKNQFDGETSPAILGSLKGLEQHLDHLLSLPEDTLQDVSIVSLHEIRKIAFNFLPETLDAYFKIQGPLARTQVIREGKTAEDLLAEQLNLLDHALASYSKALYENDARALLIQGHFLKDKFSTKSPGELSPNLEERDL